jgi:dihydrofolate reductase
VEEALAAAQAEPEVMVVGGSHLYTQMLPRADRLYLTLVEADLEGDAHFPEIDWLDWQEMDRHAHMADENNPYNYTFVNLVRRSNPAGE